MEKSPINSSLGANETRQEAEFTPSEDRILFKFFRAFFFILILASVIIGLWTHTVHNIAFGVMFYGLYKAIKYEEFDNGRK